MCLQSYVEGNHRAPRPSWRGTAGDIVLAKSSSRFAICRINSWQRNLCFLVAHHHHSIWREHGSSKTSSLSSEYGREVHSVLDPLLFLLWHCSQYAFLSDLMVGLSQLWSKQVFYRGTIFLVYVAPPFSPREVILELCWCVLQDVLPLSHPPTCDAVNMQTSLLAFQCNG